MKALELQLECIVRVATSHDHKYATDITEKMAYSAAKRGTGIAHRTPEYVRKKMDDGLAVIAINPVTGKWAGFCYIEVWQHEKYVANSGLIVSPEYRGMGISREIKVVLFEQCRAKFPHARLFSLTTSPAVIHVNTELGYEFISHSEIKNDELFVEGCNSWVNYMDLMNSDLPYVAMVFDPMHESKEPVFSQTGQHRLTEMTSTGKKKIAKLVLDQSNTGFLVNVV